MFWMDRKHIILGAVLLCAVVFGAGYKVAQVREKSNRKPVITVNPAVNEEKAKSRTVTVYITGAVKKPGVYTFQEGARINDGINKAEPVKDAELSCLNLAEIMTDQQPVFVPRKGQVDPYGDRPAGQSTVLGSSLTGRSLQSGKININTAGADALDKLPGIGPALAQRIVNYRKEHGKFKSTSELRQVSGIGEKKFAEIKDRITI